MKEPAWIDARTACALLRVKPQTLYAYVSRKHVRVRADPADARRSLYSRTDIETVLDQNQRPRARADVAEGAIRWGDPVLSTTISEVRDGMLWLRGQSVADCVDTLSLEEVASLLCNVEDVTCTTGHVEPSDLPPFARAMAQLAADTAQASPLETLARATDRGREVGRLLGLVTGALLGKAGTGPVHVRIGQAWGLSRQGTEDIRRALVALSDHELNPSTFAVRVCASTGACLPAALLAGLSALSGPRHGGVAQAARGAISATIASAVGTCLAEREKTSPYSYGFGHPLYPDGDPRASILLNHLPDDCAPRDAVAQLADRLGLPPNVDAALAAMTLWHNCPEDAGEIVFAIGRTAGWIAHAFEQVESGEIIRPRARYQSPKA